jgi:hypothetical protein
MCGSQAAARRIGAKVTVLTVLKPFQCSLRNMPKKLLAQPLV